jgi:hypothetical protein
MTGALLIAYGVSNIVALFFPLDLSNDAAVPMHIVATNGMLVRCSLPWVSQLRRFMAGSAATRSCL